MRQLEKRMPATAAAFDLAHNGDELRELVEARILSGDPQEQTEAIAIAAAAKELDELRNRWLNPPEWTREEVLEFPGSVDGPWSSYVHEAGERGIGTVRYSRLVAKDDECAKKLKKQTLTNLYNARETWLELTHQKLDRAVFAAYGWDVWITDEELLAKLLELNLQRAGQLNSPN